MHINLSHLAKFLDNRKQILFYFIPSAATLQLGFVCMSTHNYVFPTKRPTLQFLI